MERFLEISQLSVAFPKAPVPVLREIDLQIARGEYVAVIGHSGCGKSTLLNVIAGLLPATAGGVVLEGREIDGPGPSISLPSSTTPPAVAGSSPAMTFSNVDLPQPLWPMTATYSPRAICRSISRSTGTGARGKATESWEISRKRSM